MISICCVHVREILETLDGVEWPSWITPERRSRIQRFRRLGDRQRAMAGEILSRKLIASYTGIPAGDLVIRRDHNQKPFLPGMRCFFNLSHSGDFVACAVGDIPLGVDLERIRPIPDLQELSNQLFTAQEREVIRSSPSETTDLSLKRFFEYWTMKESYVKALGSGLSRSLDSFLVRFGPYGPVIVDELTGIPWYLRLYSPRKHYRLAVCASERAFPDQVELRLNNG